MHEKLIQHWQDLDRMMDRYEDILTRAGDKAMISINGAWSLLDIGDHLYYAERKSLELLKKRDASGTQKRPGLLQQLKLYWLLNFLRGRRKFNAPVKSDPRGWRSEERHTSAEGLIKDFKTVRTSFRSFLEGKDEPYYSTAVYKHPVIGPMDVNGMMKFFVEHFKRHLGQAERVLEQLDQE